MMLNYVPVGNHLIQRVTQLNYLVESSVFNALPVHPVRLSYCQAMATTLNATDSANRT